MHERKVLGNDMRWEKHVENGFPMLSESLIHYLPSVCLIVCEQF